VTGDVAEIDRVLQNLIGNAIQHGREGQTIQLALSSEGKKVRVFVKDNGPGISEERLQYVFDRFSTMKEEKGGSGLGLAIVKRVLEMHDSEYALESVEGEGTTFWFDLMVV